MAMIGTLYVISAPSGGGKTSLVNALIKERSDLCVSVSYTTRCPRIGEKEGIDYFFVNEVTFRDYQEKNLFLEYANVYDHFYGTSRDWVMQQLEAGKDVILEIDWQGARKIKAQMPCVSIFILPPALESLLVRLQERGQDDEKVIQLRMEKASEEMSHYPEYDYIVINDNFDSALSDLQAILHARRLQTPIQQGRYGHVFARLVP